MLALITMRANGLLGTMTLALNGSPPEPEPTPSPRRSSWPGREPGLHRVRMPILDLGTPAAKVFKNIVQISWQL